MVIAALSVKHSKHHITYNCKMAASWKTTGLGKLKVSIMPHNSSGKVPGLKPAQHGPNP